MWRKTDRGKSKMVNNSHDLLFFAWGFHENSCLIQYLANLSFFIIQNFKNFFFYRVEFLTSIHLVPERSKGRDLWRKKKNWPPVKGDKMSIIIIVFTVPFYDKNVETLRFLKTASDCKYYQWVLLKCSRSKKYPHRLLENPHSLGNSHRSICREVNFKEVC